MTHLMRILVVFGILVVAWAGPVRAQPAVSFVVTTLSDSNDSNLNDGVCYDGIGACSLRAAVQQASTIANQANYVWIRFSPSLKDSTLTLSLGPILWVGSYIILDGEQNNITIDGNGLATLPSMFTITGSYNQITKVTLRNAGWDAIRVGDFAGEGGGSYNAVSDTTIIGSAAAGVYVHGSASGGGKHNAIRTSLIGTTGRALYGCPAANRNGGDGIYVNDRAANTRIESNAIVCSGLNGIFLDGSYGAVINTGIWGNYIGLTAPGAAGNGHAGIYDLLNSGTEIAGNFISANGKAGVWVEGSQSTFIRHNGIGLDWNGAIALPNAHDGIAITDGANGTIVGGPLNTDANWISGNTWYGIRIRDGASNTSILGNWIGSNQAGTGPVPNGSGGIAVYASGGILIGSADKNEPLYVGGNSGAGIYIENSNAVSVRPGVQVGRLSALTAGGNASTGILLNGATNAFINPGLVAHNGGAGIAVTGASSAGNKLWPESVYANNGLPIDLGNDGPTPNDSANPPAPNAWLDYPVITSVTATSLSGTTCPSCLVKLYASHADPRQAGGGGAAITQVNASASGSWTLVLPSGAPFSQVTLTATDLLNNTSEMSPLFGRSVYIPLARR